MNTTPIQTLANVAEHTTAHVHRIDSDSALRIRLLGMGIGKGTRIEVLRNRAGDVVLGNGNNRVSLGHSITAKIIVHVQE
ncbi:MAG: ferrous iron transport protein A [Thiothrix sp.]